MKTNFEERCDIYFLFVKNIKTKIILKTLLFKISANSLSENKIDSLKFGKINVESKDFMIVKGRDFRKLFVSERRERGGMKRGEKFEQQEIKRE